MLPFRLTGDLRGASAEPNEPFPELAAERRSRWWRWTAPESGPVVVGGSGLVGIYIGNNLAQLKPDFTSGSRPIFSFEALAGTTYHLQVVPYLLSFPGLDALVKDDFDLLLSWRPPNDDFSNQTPLNGPTAVLVARHSAATAEVDEPSIGPLPPQRSVWFSWTAPADGWLELRNLAVDSDQLAAVYQGASRAQLTLLGSAWKGRERIHVPVTAGTSYALTLQSQNPVFDQPDARWELHWFPVLDHDSFADRHRLTPLLAVSSDHTLGSTRERGEPEVRFGPTDAPLQHTVWYEWTAPSTGWAQGRLQGESGQFQFQVFRGNTLPNLVPLREPDVVDLETEQYFRVEAGQIYSLMVGSPAGEFGAFTVELISPAPPANDAFAQAQLVASNATEFIATVANATREPGEPPVSDPSFGTVWFRWKSPRRGLAQIHDPILVTSIWQGASVGQLTPVNEGGGTFRTERDAEYWIRLEGNQVGATTIPLRYGNSAANDDFAKASELSGSDVWAEGTLAFATTEPGERRESSLWWRWTAPESGLLKLEPEGSTEVELRRGPGPAEAVSMLLGSWYSTWNSPTVPVEQGVTYHFRTVDGDGPVRFRVRFQPHPVPAISRINTTPGQFSLTVPHSRGRWFDLHYSTNLQTWSSLGLQWATEERVTLPATTDPTAFYRLQSR
jgi:hypothetical protein